MSLNVRELLKTCSWIDVTPQLRRTERFKKKKPASELELGTYALLFQPCEPLILVEIPCPQSPFSTSHGCVTIQWSLKTCASRLLLCAVLW